MPPSTPLLENLDKLHTTPLGAVRITRNLGLDAACDTVAFCRAQIEQFPGGITRSGKNWYVAASGCTITVNAHSYTIITAHKTR